MPEFVYTIEVTRMPEGSVNEDGSLNLAWEPKNWPAIRADLKRARIMRPDETRFFWPLSDKIYTSKSSCQKRVKLLQQYGAEAHLVRARLKWEDPRYVCPRCHGMIPDNAAPGTHSGARSRTSKKTDIEICSACGDDEAMRQYEENTLVPRSQWPVADPHKYASTKPIRRAS